MRIQPHLTALASAAALACGLALFSAPAAAPAQETWVDRTSQIPGSASRLVGAAYGAGKFVVISGSLPTYYTSTPGISDWAARAAPASVVWRGIAHGAGLFVIAGNNGALYTSATAEEGSWTQRTVSQPGDDCTSLRYLGGRFIAGRFATTGATPAESYSQVEVSTDGVTWTAKTFALYAGGGTPLTISDAAFKPGITSGNGTWVLTSEDVPEKLIVADESLTQATLVTVTGLGISQRVVYGAGRFVITADGTSGQIWTSTDGTTWTAATLPIATTSLNHVFHDGETFVAVGNSVDGSNPAIPAILSSTDGLAWTAAATTPASTRNLLFVHKADGLWLTGGVSKTFFTGGRATHSLADLEVRQTAGAFVSKQSSLQFAEIVLGQTWSETLTLRNTGTEALTGLALSFTGADATAWQATAPATTTLQPAEEITTVLTLSPTTAGQKTATLVVASNDNDENPFQLSLSGLVLTPAAPTVITDGLSQIVRVDDEAFFEVRLQQAATHQWRKGTALLPNTNSASLFISPVKTTSAGIYTLRATNSLGSVEAAPLVLGVLSPLPAAVRVNEGGTLTLTCTATLPPGLTPTYRWYRDGEPLTDGGTTTRIVTGASTKTLKVTKVVSTFIGGEGGSSDGAYMCEVSLTLPALYGGYPISGTTSTAEVTIVPKPALHPTMALPAVRVAQSITNATVRLSSVSSGRPTPKESSLPFQGIPHKFTATGLPPGILLNATTGVFTGQASAAKITAGSVVPYRVKITVSNSAGTTSGEYDWLVQPLAESQHGTYQGIIERHDTINGEYGGILQLKVEPSGRYTGTLTLAGVRHPFTGLAQATSSTSLEGSLQIKRIPATLGTFTFSFEINQGNLTGRIEDPISNNIRVDDDYTLPEAPAGIAWDTPGARAILALPGNHTLSTTPLTAISLSVLAGSPGIAGLVNGPAADARFSAPEGVLRLPDGTLLIADTGNHAVRRMDPAGNVTTLAGNGTPGALNGTGTAATFNQPCALAADPAGNIIVVDRGNHLLRKITPAGVVTTFAGKAGTPGATNGAGAAARFDEPNGIVYEPLTKSFYITDRNNALVRKATLTGVISTFAGSAKVEGTLGGLGPNCRFNTLRSIASNETGRLLVGDASGVYEFTTYGMGHLVYQDNLGTTALCDLPGDEWLAGIQSTQQIKRLDTTGATSASFYAWKSPWTSTNKPPAAYPGYYTARFNRDNASGDGPRGEGYATLTLTTTGTATWAGKLADGTPITGASLLCEGGEVPFHFMLYTGKGSLQGAVIVQSSTGLITPHTMPAADWFRLPPAAVPPTRSYASGFHILDLSLQGARYPKTPAPSLATLLSLPPTASNLRITVADVFGATNQFVLVGTVSPTGVITLPTTTSANPNQVKLTFAPATGIYTGSYTLPAQDNSPARKADFSGILIAPQNFATGYHLQPQIPEPGQSPTTTPILSGKITLSGNE